jgi:hypothetical protein
MLGTTERSYGFSVSNRAITSSISLGLSQAMSWSRGCALTIAKLSVSQNANVPPRLRYLGFQHCEQQASGAGHERSDERIVVSARDGRLTERSIAAFRSFSVSPEHASRAADRTFGDRCIVSPRRAGRGHEELDRDCRTDSPAPGVPVQSTGRCS